MVTARRRSRLFVDVNPSLIPFVRLFVSAVAQRGQTARRHQLRSQHGRTQGQGPGQPERGEDTDGKHAKQRERPEEGGRGAGGGRQDRWRRELGRGKEGEKRVT